MGKLRCPCGNRISDNADGLSYKAYLLPDTMFYRFFDKLAVTVEQFVQACEQGSLKQLLLERLRSRGITGVDGERLSDIISNTFDSHVFEECRHVFQCAACSRVLIQKAGSERFMSFMPEDTADGDYGNMLGGA